jgi:hypothetical protein
MAEFLRRDLDTKTSIRLQTRYVEEEFKQIAGFLGYLMQITYQVKFPFLLKIMMSICFLTSTWRESSKEYMLVAIYNLFFLVIVQQQCLIVIIVSH